MQKIHPSYPSAEEIDLWCEQLYDDAMNSEVVAKVLDTDIYSPKLGRFNAMDVNRYVQFTLADGQQFYALWQPTFSSHAPLVVHIPGYGAEMHEHPELVNQGYHVLHVEPLGYCTPEGRQVHLENEQGIWPVLPDTIKSKAKAGYYEWLKQAVIATDWALEHFNLDRRLSFFGTSQGGGGALLLSSIFKDKGVKAVCADVPFLTNFPLANFGGAYAMAKPGLSGDKPTEEEWHSLGYIDTLSHAHRLLLPVLLTAGEVDITTPPDTIKSLFEVLPATRSYTELKGVGHRYTKEFVPLTLAWLRLYG